MTVQEIAKLHNVSPGRVKRWISSGKLAATYRPIGNGGKRITRVSRDDYNRFLEAQKDQSRPRRQQ